MKTLTREQLTSRKERAVRFTRDVLGESARAAEIEDESLEDYADRRGIALSNPRRKRMSTLKEQVEDLENVLAQAQSVLEDAYQPEATREDLAQAVGEALDIIAGDDIDEDEDEDDLDADEDDEEGE